MAQGDYLIQNQGFPAFRSDLNSTLEAINTSNSGTSRPTSAVAGTIWLDTTNATNPTLKFFDGNDDISLATIDYSANTVNWLDSSVVADLVNDSTPQLGGNLDVNGNSIVSVSNGNITFTPDGTGKVIIDGLSFPTSDGTADQFLKTDGSGNLSFDTVSTAGTVLTTQGDILYRDGSGLQRLGAGTAGQVLQTGGAGSNPSWTTPATGGAISANQAALNGSHSTTSTSYVSIGSGLSVTVTPASTGSKFLILFSGAMNGGAHYLNTTVFRDASNLATDVNASATIMGSSDGSTAGWESGAWHYLDAPNTTSSITYEAKFKSGNGATVYFGDGSAHIQTLQVIEL